MDINTLRYKLNNNETFTVQDCENLKKYLNETCVITWEIDDVKSIDPQLTDEQCIEVLSRIENKHDASFGVCWDTLGAVVQDLRS